MEKQYKSWAEARWDAPRRMGKLGGRKSSKIKYKDSTTISDYKSGGHECLETNPLETPEAFSVRLYCNKCKIMFGMSLIRHNELTSNCENFSIKNRAETKLCPKCHKTYLNKQSQLKKKGILTDIEIGELAEEITKHPYGWEYQLGFIDGFIKMRDKEKNILSEIID